MTERRVASTYPERSGSPCGSGFIGEWDFPSLSGEKKFAAKSEGSGHLAKIDEDHTGRNLAVRFCG